MRRADIRFNFMPDGDDMDELLYQIMQMLLSSQNIEHPTQPPISDREIEALDAALTKISNGEEE